MIDIGVDFGSTYTTVSIYQNGVLTALNLDNGSPYVPSVVAIENEEYLFGSDAKEATGTEDVRIFKAFKMLLPEQKKEKYVSRGYDMEHTPAKVTAIFLEHVLRRVLFATKETKIHRLVIGVPEIWSGGIGTLSGRSTLRDICREFDFVDKGHVQVVSEPAAASAFFAYNFLQAKKYNFEGNILLVDYGGGTLDITLTNVTTVKSSDGRDKMEIKPLECGGVGENVDGNVGKAGIVYMETVMEEAIRNANILKEGEEWIRDDAFFQVVDELEKKLKNSTIKIQDTLSQSVWNFEHFDSLYQQKFATFKYERKKVEVTYGLLVEVYNKIIYSVLQTELDKITRYISQKLKIDYMDGSLENFKIALVGGFGLFYLVKKQLEDYFDYLGEDYDLRMKDIIKIEDECEKAISYGAALLASDVVTLRCIAPYSIGIWSRNQQNKICYNYAMEYKQDIEYDHIYYHYGADKRETAYWFPNGSFDRFAISWGSKDRGFHIKPEYMEKLRNIVTVKPPTAVIGFSMDSSEVLTLHVHNYSEESGMDPKDHEIDLAQFGELFDVTSLDD